jgi:cupin 2 domain-containing protein
VIENIFNNIPENLPEELIQTLVKNDKIKIERIVSNGHSSPKDFWYDQNKNEWVILLKGSARILFKENLESISLSAGDYVNIPAHVLHCVEWTDPSVETIWLAVFY